MSEGEHRDSAHLEPRRQSSTIEIQNRSRVLCTVGGVIVVGFAGVLTWRGVDGAATVAFVALAAVFFLLAIAGVVPRRIKVGDTEADITRDEIQQAAIETADAAIATMTPDEIKQFITDNLRQMSQGDPTGIKAVTASRAQEAADLEHRVAVELELMFPESAISKRADGLLDFLIRRGEVRFGVICRLGLNLSIIKQIAAARVKVEVVIVITRDWNDTRIREVRNYFTHEDTLQKIAVCPDDPYALRWLLNAVVNRQYSPQETGMKVVASFPLGS